MSDPDVRLSRPPRARRGAALLLVLAALAMLMPVCLGLSRTVATSKLSSRIDRDVALVEDLLVAAEAPIEEWLKKRAPSLVLPPESQFPAALVLDERIGNGDDGRHLKIAAWDQLGLIPLALARGASPLRLAMPREVTSALDRGPRRDRLPGLDWYADHDPRGGAWSEGPFPPAPLVETTDGRTVIEWPATTSTAIGASIATHGSGAINVSTAPIKVIEAALRELGRSGIEPIIAARAKGEAVPLPASGRPLKRGEKAPFEMVSKSDCFAFRIDARAGAAARSWWAIYGEDDGRWRLLQRMVIRHG